MNKQIGAVNDSPVGKGAWFDTPLMGVRAQIQHLKGYASKEPLKNPCVDPRYQILVYNNLTGIAPNWEDLNGRWAVPGTTYSQSILEIYNKALALPPIPPVEDIKPIIEDSKIEPPIQPIPEEINNEMPELNETQKNTLINLIMKLVKFFVDLFKPKK